MKTIVIKIACQDYEADDIMAEFFNSHIAQRGLYTFGCTIKDTTSKEKEEVMAGIPKDIAEDIKEEEHN